MRRQILFIQGGGEGTHDEWDNRLVDSLQAALGPDCEISYPRMPDEADPAYKPWQEAIASHLAALDDGAVVIGHSIGATILVHAIAAGPPPCRLGAIVLLAAPFVGAGGWASDELAGQEVRGGDLPDGVPVHIYHGSADDTAPIAHAGLYAAAIPQAIIHRLAGRDHQLNDDLSEVAADINSLR